MTFIAASIDLLKSLIKPKKIAPHEVSAMLESIHGALLAMNRKETTLATGQTVTPPPSQDASPEILSALPLPEDDTTESVARAIPIPNNGVADDGITCLICGETRKILIRHLRARHEMDESAYRLQFNLDESVPLIAPAHSRVLLDRAQQRSASTSVAKAKKNIAKGDDSAPSEPPSDISDQGDGDADDAVTCLLCGETVKRLRPHLKNHHQTDEESYLHQFNLPESTPMVAPSLSRLMAEMARARHAASRLAKEQTVMDEAAA